MTPALAAAAALIPGLGPILAAAFVAWLGIEYGPDIADKVRQLLQGRPEGISEEEARKILEAHREFSAEDQEYVTRWLAPTMPSIGVDFPALETDDAGTIRRSLEWEREKAREAGEVGRAADIGRALDVLDREGLGPQLDEEVGHIRSRVKIVDETKIRDFIVRHMMKEPFDRRCHFLREERAHVAGRLQAGEFNYEAYLRVLDGLIRVICGNDNGQMPLPI